MQCLAAPVLFSDLLPELISSMARSLSEGGGEGGVSSVIRGVHAMPVLLAFLQLYFALPTAARGRWEQSDPSGRTTQR